MPAGPALHVAKLMRYAASLCTTVGATWWGIRGVGDALHARCCMHLGIRCTARFALRHADRSRARGLQLRVCVVLFCLLHAVERSCRFFILSVSTYTDHGNSTAASVRVAGAIGARRMVAHCILHGASAPVSCVTLHRRALHVALASVASVASPHVASCVGAWCMLHRCELRIATARGSCCIGDATSSLSALLCDALDGGLRVRCTSGRRAGFAVAERRCDALVRSPALAACSPWPRAPRCSTPWRYPAPEQGCVRGGPGWRCESGRMRVGGGGCRRTGCRADCNERGCAGCAERRRGFHVRWGRHVQGR
jgi:hypothetical protein